MAKTKPTKIAFGDNAVLSAIRGAEFAPKTLKNGRLKVYTGWEDGIFTRGRVWFNQKDGPQISYFLHISPDQIKIWEDKSNNPSPDHIINGVFV